MARVSCALQKGTKMAFLSMSEYRTPLFWKRLAFIIAITILGTFIYSVGVNNRRYVCIENYLPCKPLGIFVIAHSAAYKHGIAAAQQFGNINIIRVKPARRIGLYRHAHRLGNGNGERNINTFA